MTSKQNPFPLERLDLAFTDRQTLGITASCVILLVSGLHILLGTLMICSEEASKATDLAAVIASLSMAIPPNRFLSGAVLLASAGLGIVGDVFKIRKYRAALFWPQQFFLGVMSGGGLVASCLGHYLDGTKVLGIHIFADQIVFLFLFGAHWRAMFGRCDVSE